MLCRPHIVGKGQDEEEQGRVKSTVPYRNLDTRNLACYENTETYHVEANVATYSLTTQPQEQTLVSWDRSWDVNAYTAVAVILVNKV